MMLGRRPDKPKSVLAFSSAAGGRDRHSGVRQAKDSADISRKEPRLAVDLDYANGVGEVVKGGEVGSV